MERIAYARSFNDGAKRNDTNLGDIINGLY
jgi:hypothetical protein